MPAAAQQLFGFSEGAGKLRAMLLFIQGQQHHGSDQIINGRGHGEPFHALSRKKKPYFIGRDDGVGDCGGNSGIFGLQFALEPVVKRVHHLKENADPAKYHDPMGRGLSPIHDQRDAHHHDQRQRAGDRPQDDRRAYGFPFFFRVIDKIFDDHGINSQGAERREKRRIGGRIVDQPIVARPQIPRRQQAHDKRQRHMINAPADQPAGIFRHFTFQDLLNLHRQASESFLLVRLPPAYWEARL